MKTEVLPADKDESIRRAAAALRAGDLVAFPTDTVYGLGANPFDAAAVARLYEVKQRPQAKGIPILVGDAGALTMVADHVPPLARRLMERYWPGPLTLVVGIRSGLPTILSPNDGVAVRLPDHDAARDLIRAAGGALAATSANLSSRPPAQTAEEARATLHGRVPIILNGGRTRGDVPSTVVDCRGREPRILRPGPVSAGEISRFLALPL